MFLPCAFSSDLLVSSVNSDDCAFVVHTDTSACINCRVSNRNTNLPLSESCLFEFSRVSEMTILN